ncbi:MAG: hypothetical protein LBU91_06430 [Bacteroidales bacterium]|jgi:NADH:ubiquinone oxidoreductase subunit 6 (subunit J)|nr:hypothetical protein [Bacteroidales bacterium]
MDILIDVGMYLTYALLGASLLAFVFFAIWQVIQNPQRSKVALYGIVGCVVVFGIAMLLSSGTDLPDIVLEKTSTSHATSRWIGAGLITTYILFFGTMIALLTVEVMKPFKK